MFGNLFNPEARELSEVQKRISEIDDSIARAKHKDYKIAVDALTKLREQYSGNATCVAAIDAKRYDYEREVENENFVGDLRRIKAKLHSSRKNTGDYADAINGLDSMIAQYPFHEEATRAEIALMENEKKIIDENISMEKSKRDFYQGKSKLETAVDMHQRDLEKYTKAYELSGSEDDLRNFKESYAKLNYAKGLLSNVQRTEEMYTVDNSSYSEEALENAAKLAIVSAVKIASQYKNDDVSDEAMLAAEMAVQEKIRERAQRKNNSGAMNNIDRMYNNSASKKAELMSDEDALAEMAKIHAQSTPKLNASKREINNTVDNEKKKLTNDRDTAVASSGKKTESGSRQYDSDAETHFQSVDPDDIDVCFDDVKGLDSVREAIERAVVYPMIQPEAFARLNDKPGTGILMYGLPGTGKSMIAKATAKECNAKFYNIRRSDIIRPLVGDSETRLRRLFEEARQHKHAIIFFDEFDGLALQRGIGQTYDDSLTNEFLALMDGLNKTTDNKLLIIAASNFPGKIDEAFFRSGRLQKAIRIPMPNQTVRKEIIESAYKGVVISHDIDIDDLAGKMEGYGGADVAGFCHISKEPAHDRYKESKNSDDLEIRPEDIEYAHMVFRRRTAENSLKELDDFERSLQI